MKGMTRVRNRAALLGCTAILALAGGLVSAAPASAENVWCTYGSSDGNTLTCIHVGTSWAYSSARVYNSTRVLQTCLWYYGTRQACYGPVQVSPGQVIHSPTYYGNGSWEARTWRYNSDGTSTLIGFVYGNN